VSLDNKKTILRKFPSGLFIVTANDKGIGTGAVISFATQISMDPPYIALSIRKDTSFYETAKINKYLAVHLPSKDQQKMVASFFKIKERDVSSINGYLFEWSDLKNPILNDIPMILEAKIIDVVEKGDHPVFIAEIVKTILRKDVDMLTMADTNWHYGG
jgi:flavin reductase (DIM6/NTAB) family NADH-FMN oxidoreductase RutF